MYMHEGTQKHIVITLIKIDFSKADLMLWLQPKILQNIDTYLNTTVNA